MDQPSLAYTSDAFGASSWLWRVQHNQLHHGNTNVDGYDADMELAPWARLAPTQPWHRRFRWQHVYIWPLYGFLAIKNLLVSDVLTLVHGRFGERPLPRRPSKSVIFGIGIGKLGHVTWALAVPMLFNPWRLVLGWYVACSWFVGFTLAMMFQLAHCVDNAQVATPETARRGDEFAEHQLRTTVDVASPVPVVGHLFRWLAGGLDHQVVHHLAPGLPHTIYPRLATRFRGPVMTTRTSTACTPECSRRSVRTQDGSRRWAADLAPVRPRSKPRRSRSKPPICSGWGVRCLRRPRSG